MSEELKEMILPELGEVKRLFAESRTELADKDAEIAELKRLLAEKEK